jgi:hypothetical protein
MKFIKDWFLLSAISLFVAIILSSIDFLLTGRPGLILSTLLPFFSPNILWMGLDENLLFGILILIVYSLPLYLVAGLIFTGIYKILQKRLSIKKSFWITVGCIIIGLFFFTGIKIYMDDIKYRKSNYLGQTETDCRVLEDSNQKRSCYRSMYRRNSVPEVCLSLLGLEGEATECARRYGVQSGDISNCSVFKKESTENDELRQVYDYPTFQENLYNNCRLGATFIKKDKTLCKQLPADDGLPEYNVLSTQESCITMIDYWDNNINFYLYPETSAIYSEHIWDFYLK